MLNLQLYFQDDPILRQPTSIVDYKEEGLKDLIEEMIKLTKTKNGIGLAAPQVGVSKKLIIVKDIENDIFLEMLNPEIVWTSYDKDYKNEGCLSIVIEDKPVTKSIWRYNRIRVKWQDQNGLEHEELIKDRLLSRIIQHEIDHLNGKLIIDY